jgi:hypothetical protein
VKHYFNMVSEMRDGFSYAACVQNNWITQVSQKLTCFDSFSTNQCTTSLINTYSLSAICTCNSWCDLCKEIFSQVTSSFLCDCVPVSVYIDKFMIIIKMTLQSPVQ